MTLRPLVFALAGALALPLTAQAANYTYHGDLMDGDAPAEGAYDLRVRAFAQPGATKTLGEATELPGVKLSGGRFSVELDVPEDADGTTWVEVAVRKAGSNDPYEKLGDPQPIAKVNSTCPGAWALDGNSGAPSGSFLGFADARAVFINSPSGVALNTLVPPSGNIDLSLNPKTSGDADVDLQWKSRSGKDAGAYLSDGNGNLVQYASSGAFEFYDGIPTATQNNGLETFTFSGRLRSRAAGINPTDASGGIWFDDERARASFVGRGDNQSNWTGIYEATGGWRFTAHDNGAFGFNTNTEALPANRFKVNAVGGVYFNPVATYPLGDAAEGMVIGPQGGLDNTVVAVLARRPSGAWAKAYFAIQAQGETAAPEAFIGATDQGSGTPGRIRLANRVGILRPAFTNELEVEGNASKTTATAWLANSDRRIKTGIAPIPEALDTIMKLRPVTFRYDDAYRKAHDSIGDERYYNVIAQEFAEVFPDAVKGSGEYLPGRPQSKDNEILQVDTYPAQIVTIAAVQELAALNSLQDEELATLRRDVSVVRSQNALLTEQVEQLLSRLRRSDDRQGQ